MKFESEEIVVMLRSVIRSGKADCESSKERIDESEKSNCGERVSFERGEKALSYNSKKCECGRLFDDQCVRVIFPYHL